MWISLADTNQKALTILAGVGVDDTMPTLKLFASKMNNIDCLPYN